MTIGAALTSARFLVSAGDWWHNHWPFERGKAVLFRLNNMLYHIGVFRPIVARTSHGIPMELDGRDLVSQTILLNGVWDPKVTGFVAGNLPVGGVFLDVGAHIGYCSLLASRVVGPTGTVVAIEPNPPTIARLERNIHLNQAANIIVRKVACTERETTLRFYAAGIENTGRSSINCDNSVGGQETSVPGMPLDKVVQSLGLKRVDLIKIDVEGSEMQVLAGMRHILSTYHPKIIIELIPDLLTNMGSSLGAAMALFEEHGYSLHDRDEVNNYFWVPAPQPAVSH